MLASGGRLRLSGGLFCTAVAPCRQCQRRASRLSAHTRPPHASPAPPLPALMFRFLFFTTVSDAPVLCCLRPAPAPRAGLCLSCCCSSNSRRFFNNSRARRCCCGRWLPVVVG